MDLVTDDRFLPHQTDFQFVTNNSFEMVSKPILPKKETLQTVPTAGDCIADTRKRQEESNASACITVWDRLN